MQDASSSQLVSIDPYLNILKRLDPIKKNGKVSQVIGLTIESHGPDAQIGELCHIYPNQDGDPVLCEVVGFKADSVLLMPLGPLEHISPGCDVIATGETLQVKVGDELLGQVLDGLGRPLNGSPLSPTMEVYPAYQLPPNPLLRPRIEAPLSVGVKAIDTLLTIGCGQRVGIFAGSGVGKSTLLGMIARNTEADINVIALIGERGREVREFIERDLGEEGLRRSVVVVATSDQPALIRIKGAFVATAIAEYFRDQGKNVMLMMDSVTRFAMAQREVGLAIGEPPATKGYTPSVFALLPRLMERAGTSEKGSITGFYTVLVEGDDMNEPIVDAARGILDGHIVLNRKIAQKGQYPAIDILQSVSRLMKEIVSDSQLELAQKVRTLLATYQEAEDLIQIGAYKRGSQQEIDQAIQYHEPLRSFLMQGVNVSYSLSDSFQQMAQLLGEAE
ncbi:flagellar protein export ATPase FliI [Rubeoparvulum massiliense]|uniref:flagellar protein export ATPase FliI n=1 Tax=Rubeoparvulum massiliense TaxID=1631346 RepID=UPI00065E4F1E|nr:flagellar protein export ATPase FliI [Rubeoparvulum massiliense]